MKPKQGYALHKVGLAIVIALCAAFVAYETQPRTISAAQSFAGAEGRTHKHPKLSTQVAHLKRAVPQNTQPPAPGERIASPPGFAVEKLPKSIRDAVHAGQMHITNDAEVQVYISVSEISERNLEQLRLCGVVIQLVGSPDQKPGKTGKLAGVPAVFNGVPTVQGLLPVTMIDQVAALPFVRFIGLPAYGIPQTGSVDTQGDSILKADQVRSLLGVDGTGVRVGVISGGIGGVFATTCTTCGPTSSSPSPIALGDLPNATGTRNSSGVLTSVSGGIIAQSFDSNTDLEAGNAEGTAMLEIVHDLAPGAQLLFANFDTNLAFEQAVNFLAANADVVVDDVGFPGLPPYDGTNPLSTNTATALNTDTNPIRGYFTAVGNFAQDHYDGQYVASGTDGTSITGQAGNLHLFRAVSGVTVDDENFGPSIADPATVPPSGIIRVLMAWNDPPTGSSNDYDLFLIPLSCNGFSSTNQLPLPPCTISGPPLASSTNPQTGTQPPVEQLAYVNSSASPIAVGIVIQNVNNAAAARTFDMFIVGTLGDRPNPDHNFNTVSGSVPAEADAGGSPVSVVSVGAIDQTQCSGLGNCTGSVEPYSSQGPTEATPQAASRMKPDVTGVDGVCVTGAGGFGTGPATSCPPGQPTSYTPQTFFGTSAAAPHAASVAALLLQSAPCLLASSTANTPPTARTNLRTFLTSTAVPLPGVSQPVPNNIEGFGLIDALSAVQKTLPTANAGSSQTVNGTSTSGASVTFSGSGTDPDSCPITLSWSGSCGTAMGANPALTCPIGADTETLTVSNGGAKTSLPTSFVQIAVTDFVVFGPRSGQSVQPGQPATYAITVGPVFGAFTNPVTLACSAGLPSLTSCSFSPPSVTPPSFGLITSTLTISTTAPSSVFPTQPRGWPSLPLFSARLGLLLILLAGAILAKRSGRKLAAAFTFGALLICVVSVVVACSGGGGGPHNPGTPAGPYTVTLTGTSNQLQHSTTVILIVQ